MADALKTPVRVLYTVFRYLKEIRRKLSNGEYVLCIMATLNSLKGV